MAAISSLIYYHVTKNVFLLLLSVLTLPLSTVVVIFSLLATKLTFATIHSGEQFDASRPRKNILVTGVSMTKGLAISRLLAQHTPHRIIGADVEPVPFTSPARYSRSLSKFVPLASPKGTIVEPYIKSLLSVIKKHDVDLWISCSSVGSALEDGIVARRAEEVRGPSFQAVQFPPETVEKFDRKDEFISYVASLGLPVPESHRCKSSHQVEEALSAALKRNGDEKGKENYSKKRHETPKRFILKPLGVNDRARSKMIRTLLPLDTPEATTAHIKSLGASKENPFQLQQYIAGTEYCTHSLIVGGVVKAFVACTSSDMLMHYKAMNPSSPLHHQMLVFTEKVAQAGGESFTGHLSFDFIAEWKGNKVKLYPIECNPRAHTAVVLFSETPEMADAYLDAFAEEGSRKKREGVIFPHSPCHSYYWVGHDLVTLLIMPVLEKALGGKTSWNHIGKQSMLFWHHLLYWRDGTFVTWDPFPFWVLYHMYWPVQFVKSLVAGSKWSRINVSTTKVFGC